MNKLNSNAWRLLFLLSVVLVFASVNGCGGKSEGEANVLRFGMISTESTVGLQRGFDPFIEDMSKALGVPVKAYFASDYAGMIEAMRFGKVDIAWLGNKSAIEAIERANGEVFAQTVAADGSPGYWSVIIVHKDSPYQSVDDIIKDGKELTFGNGDPHSTSGYLVPAHFLWAQKKIDPKSYFKRVVNSNHEANGLAVAVKHVDFATNNTESLMQIEEQKPDLFKKLRVVWKSPLIATDPLVWRKDLPEDMKKKVKTFVMDYGRKGENAEKELEILKGMSSGWAPFNDSSDDQLLPIWEIMVSQRIAKLEKDDSLSGEEKEKQLKELKEKLNGLKERSAALKK